MADLIFFIPVAIFLFAGWMGIRAANQVIREMGPDTPMLYPLQPRRSLLEWAMDAEPEAMPARTVRRIGICFVLISPLPLGFGIGWHVFSPAHWLRVLNSPCGEIIAAELVEKYTRSSVDVAVSHRRRYCYAHCKTDTRVLTVRIERHRGARAFDFAEELALKFGPAEIERMQEFLGESRVIRSKHETLLMVVKSGYLFRAELRGRLKTPRAEAAIRKAIKKHRHRIDLNRQ